MADKKIEDEAHEVMQKAQEFLKELQEANENREQHEQAAKTKEALSKVNDELTKNKAIVDKIKSGSESNTTLCQDKVKNANKLLDLAKQARESGDHEKAAEYMQQAIQLSKA